MVEALVRTKKLGGSLIVTIPKKVADIENIGANDLIKLNVSRVKKDGFGLLKDLLKDKKKLKIIREEVFISHYD